jgi:hypothetical protein
MSNNPRRDKILAATNVQAELVKCGVRIAPGAVQDDKGWLKVHSLYNKDDHPSASINVGDDPNTRGLYHDFVLNLTKSFFDIVAEFGPYPCMTGRDAYLYYGKQTGVLNGGASSSNKKGRNGKPKGKIVNTYDYHDAVGNLIFQVCRMEPKDFRQRRPDGNGDWIWNMAGIERVLYRLTDLKAAALVFIVEGEKSADRLRSLGVTATCSPGGAGKWKTQYNDPLKGKVVCIIGDNDPPGRGHAEDVARKLYGVAASIRVVELPGLPDKGDVFDWLDAGGTLEQLRSLVEATPDWDPATAPSPTGESSTSERSHAIPKECGHYYAVTKGCHNLVLVGENEIQEKPLCNFIAQITDEITRDDGLSITKEFIISGNVTDLPLSSAKVPTKDFDAMKWVRQEWGTAASITPTRNNAAHLPNAILSHSRGSGINRRTLYAHTGWRQVNGVWRYLHGGGGIGPGAPVAVDLGENLGNYHLPDPGGLEAAQASLRFLGIGPWEVTATLWACVHLAPLTDLLKIDFSPWLYGPTGSLKSTVAALAQAHFGNFTRLTLPGSWFSTVNALEKLTFILKDTMCVIDDFCPPANQKESHAMAERAGRIIYQAGNRSARGRLGPDLMARPNYYPRSLIVSTAEMLLPGQRQSATARCLAVEFDPKKTPIDKARLSEAQSEAHLYPAAMAAYLEGMASQLDDTLDEVRDLWTGYRIAFQNSSHHMRIPEVLAWLFIGFELGSRFQVSMGAITPDESYEMQKRAWKVFEALGEKQSQIIQGDRPTLKFMAVLRELFIQGRIYVESSTTTGAPPPNQRLLGWHGTELDRNAELLGWADESTIYLLPEATVRTVKEAVRRQGDYLSLGHNELLAALVREKISEPAANGRTTQPKWIQGSTKRVICISLKKMHNDEVTENENS